MGIISDRLGQIIASAGDLSPLAAPIQKRLVDGNREMILGGVTPDGHDVAPVKPETMNHRGGTGPPRAPRGSASRAITRCVVAVFTAGGRISFTKSWPGFDQAVAGMDRTRPMMGFRPADLQWCRDQLRAHVLRKGR